MRNSRLVPYGLILISLILGSTFYIFPELRSFLSSATIGISFSFNGILDFLSYSLSDGLWMVALCTTILVIWDMEWTFYTILFYVLAIILGISFEVLQWFHRTPGTFDWNDIIAIIVGAMIPLVLTIKKPHYEKVS